MRNTFFEALFRWLDASGLSVEHLSDDDELFAEIVISGPGSKSIHLKLIEFDKWIVNSDEGLEELDRYAEKMSKIRSTGMGAAILWEDVWRFRPEVVKSRILSMLGKSERIPGRLTVVRRIDKKTALEFLNHNHLQGAVNSKTQYALYLPARYFRVLKSKHATTPEQDLLVAVATFSHGRIFRKNDIPFRSFELIRFCNLNNVTVVGGLDKLLKAFAKDFNPGDIMTYADLEWSDGAGYVKLGFEPQKDIEPIVFEVDIASMARQVLSATPSDELLSLQVINQGSRKYVKVFQTEADS